MDTSATALMHDIGAILDDFKMEMIEDPLHHWCAQDIEEKIDSLTKDIKGLFNSSYSFNK